MRKADLAFCLAVFAALLALGGGGMNRRRILASLGGGWKNPYVTDGLVAMWDGEWNAGGGVHDPNAGRLVNLSGDGHDLIVEANGVIEDRCLSFNGVSARTGELSYRPQTIEIVVNAMSGRAISYYSYGYQTKSFSPVIVLRPNNGGIECGIVNDNSTKFKYVSSSVIGLHSFSTRSNGTLITDVKMNNVSQNSTRSNAWGNQDFLTIGGHGNVNTYDSIGKLFCLRFYNRMLSDGEVGANYGIDKARFGLT